MAEDLLKREAPTASTGRREIQKYLLLEKTKIGSRRAPELSRPDVSIRNTCQDTWRGLGSVILDGIAPKGRPHIDESLPYKALYHNFHFKIGSKASVCHNSQAFFRGLHLAPRVLSEGACGESMAILRGASQNWEPTFITMGLLRRSVPKLIVR